MRILIDSTILVSGLFFQGNERKLIQEAIDGRFDLVLPESIITEARSVIEEKFAGHPGFKTALESLALLSKIAEIVPESEAVRYFQQAKASIRDVKDAPHLAAALASKPDILATSDSDYYALAVPAPFLILTARQILIELGKA
jgi:putative PIN family toxin of toxin-antitoxin system